MISLFYFGNYKEMPQVSINSLIQKFSFLREEKVYFSNVSVLSCILLPIKFKRTVKQEKKEEERGTTTTTYNKKLSLL